MGKKWFCAVISSFLILCIAFSILTFLVDPFQQYRIASKYVPTINNEMYFNPGLAKNYECTTAIIGSSMTENFNTSDFENIFGGKALKLPYSGAMFHEEYKILDILFKHQSPENIVWAIDLPYTEVPATKVARQFPEYLYDDSIVNDLPYLLNINILSKYTKNAITNANKKSLDQEINDAYNWSAYHIFSRDTVLKGYKRSPITNEPSDKMINIEKVEENFSVNIEPLLKNNPDTQFHFFFAPYSILYWVDNYDSGILERKLFQRAFLCEKLLQYPNAHIYDFQHLSDIVCNLDNYKDYSHYSPAINHLIAESMGKDDFKVTKEKLLENNSKITANLNNFINQDTAMKR